MKTVVVAGAAGVIGRSVLSHFEQQKDVRTIAVSRRSPEFTTRGEHISVDLLNGADTIERLAGAKDATHIVYAAYKELPSISALVEPNLTMLRNVVTAIENISEKLEHVTLMQGGARRSATL